MSSFGLLVSNVQRDYSTLKLLIVVSFLYKDIYLRLSETNRMKEVSKLYCNVHSCQCGTAAQYAAKWNTQSLNNDVYKIFSEFSYFIYLKIVLYR